MKPKKIFAGIGVLVALLVALGAVLVVRTVRVGAGAGAALEHPAVQPAELPRVGLEAVERLAGALRIPTVSREGSPPPLEDLKRLHAYLETSFPRAHEVLDRQVVAGGSLLYTWQAPGAPVGTAEPARPLLLLAHLDTVPVAPGSEGRWSHPPFAGAVADGAVWGRGAMDDKAAVTASLEAVDRLLADGFEPARPVLLAFGCDEEVGGRAGAARIAALLGRRHVRPFLVLDEGQAVIDGLMPGIESPVAMVGVAEKGYLSVTLTAHGPEGHSSTPPPETAVDVLAAALVRLHDDPFPAGIDGPPRAMLEALAPEMPFSQRLVMANLWLFEPVVTGRLAADPASAALLRTTVAPTMLEGSPKDNVLPAEARAVVNFRLHPRDTIDGVLARVEETVADERVEVEPAAEFSSEPSAVSPADGPAYRLVTDTIAQVVPGAAVAPSLVVGGTDARHYAGLTESVYRFLPYTIRPGDLARIHGTDERILLDDYERMVQFYVQLIRNASARESTSSRRRVR